jgi:hypothetical protein
MKKSLLTFLQLLPVCLSLLVLAAHFLRSAHFIAAAICIMLTFIVFVYKPYAARLAQIALLIGTFEWIATTLALSAERSAVGAPALRMQIILGSVASVCFLSIFVFYSRTLRERFGLGRRPDVQESPDSI